jgi:acyl-CoA oxidase
MMEGIKSRNFSTMDTMHHLLSGFKAKFTDEAAISIDKCRLSTGGAGFASHAGFTDIAQNASPNQTWEGDNTVLSLQATKFVFKLYKKAKVDPAQQLPFPFTYISNIDKLLAIKGRGKTVEEMLDLEVLHQALAVRAAVQVRDTVEAIAQSHATNKEKDNDLFAQMKIDMVRAHINYLVFTIFRH